MSKNFNIKETVNKNIQNNQFPAFTNHRSMVGWCSMNYPKVLVNPVYLNKQQGVPDDKKYQIDTLFQKKNPTQREVVQFNKPFTNYEPKIQEKQGNVLLPEGSTKNSSLTLATVNHDQKAKIFESNNRIIEPYSAMKPISTILGPNQDNNFDRKVRQIGEVFYNPPNEGEEMRHLKKLPNTVINQQNLMTILSPQLEHLDLQYKTDISNDLINKIGYLAPNIKSLNLTAVPIENNVLIELGKSCKKLESIDISKCDKIQEFAVINFLKDCQNLKEFSASHMQNAITDACLECFLQNQQLSILNINFCYDVTSTGIQFLEKKQFKKLGLSSLPNIKGEDIGKLVSASVNELVCLDISFNVEKDINNNLMGKVGMCTKIQEISLTGCEKISDEGINNLIYGEKGKGKQPEGFTNLKTLKVGGLNISDQLHQIVKRSPSILFLEANNLQRLTDNFLDQMKNYPGERTVLINFTPNITDEKIKQIQEMCKNMKLIRNVSKMTDPSDDGLRMPIPPASLKVKKPKKKKK